MYIKEFAKEAGISIDTARFYIKRGLIQPDLGKKGGSNRYQVFGPEHLESVHLVRMGQLLGMSLREIEKLSHENRSGMMTCKRKIELIHELQQKLLRRRASIDAAMAYLKAKLDWLEHGALGPEPIISACGDGVHPAKRVRAARKRTSRTRLSPNQSER